MNTTSSPPGEALEFRGKTLTPVSPKPVLFPSPANIPILEKQMDPVFGEASSSIPQVAQSSGQTLQNPADSLISYDGYMDGLAQSNGEKIDNAAANGTLEEAMATLQGQGTVMEGLSTSNAFTGQDDLTAAPPSDTASNTILPEQSALPASILPASSSDLPLGQPASALSQPAAEQVQAQAESIGEAPVAGDSVGGINIQTLLDNLSPSIDNNAAPQRDGNSAASPSADGTQPSALENAISPSSIQGNPNLPPRPPPQEKPISHPNYSAEDDIRSFHPHSQKASGSNNTNANGASIPPQAAAPPILTVGSNGLPPPPPASFQGQNKPSTDQVESPLNTNQAPSDSTGKKDDANAGSDEEVQWSPETQKVYDDFLQDERKYVTEGQWDKFPANSRLFIGNLPTEKVTKRDLFQIFHQHGKLAQISIKQAYGFIQFLDAGACQRALQNEQGMAVRGRKMHLEISKPQRNRGGDNNRNNRRRSRSPDYNRNSYGSRGIDRYISGQIGSPPREREFRRVRDDYRPGRSPSPRGYRGRRDRSRDRSRGRYDGRRRSRSRSPYGRSERYRSPSPRRDSDDDLPLPRRAPRDVPDVQMIVLDDLDRNFIAYIEKSFQDRSVRCDVLLLSPRLSEAAVVRRQILEGVHAVSRITRACQQTGKIPLQVFDRRGGSDSVRFEEYDNLDPTVCAELVLRAKKNNSGQLSSPYGMPASYGMPPQYGFPQQQSQPPQPAQATAAPNNFGNLIGSLDGAGLQKLLSSMQQQQHQVQQPAAVAASQNPGMPASGLTPDLARLLGGGGNVQPQQPGYGHPTQGQQTNSFAALSGNPALASLLGGVGGGAVGAVAPQTAQQMQHGGPPQAGGPHALAGQPDMQEIMAQLAKYRR